MAVVVSIVRCTMSDAVLVAIITAISTIICQLLINRSNQKKRLAEDAEKEKNRAVKAAIAQKELENELKEIKEQLRIHNQKLDIHNGYAEKLGAIEKSMAVLETEIKNIYKDEKK